ncbi:MAG: hypothetical protein IPG97_00960 [Microthrixaceae bacterium]|nr:hypothetical protein [Microthrixaceae bacterium]
MATALPRWQPPLPSPEFPSWPEPGDPPVIGFHATNDTTVPPSGAREKCAAAVYIGLVCEWIEYPDGGHGVVSSEFRDIVERSHTFFYEQVLGPLGYDPGVGPTHPPLPPRPPLNPTVTTTTSVTTTTLPGGSTTTTTSSLASASSTTSSTPNSEPTSTSGVAVTSTTGRAPTTGQPRPPVDHVPGARPAAAIEAPPSYTG